MSNAKHNETKYKQSCLILIVIQPKKILPNITIAHRATNRKQS